jgi:hypothetical protein
MRIALVCAVIVTSALSACTSQPPQVTHVVICWLKKPGNEADRQRLIDESEKLKQIPGLLSLTAGRPISSPRPVVDASYDVAFVMTFKDEAALRAYEKNPIHVRAVNDVLRPLAGKLVIYDIRRAEAGAGAKKGAGATKTPAPDANQGVESNSSAATKP